jgi:hypothetical protein
MSATSTLIFNFDLPWHLEEHKETKSDFCKAIEVALKSQEFAKIHLHINVRKTNETEHRHMKIVWLKSQEYIWEKFLKQYDGDVLFLEEDVIPSPDFYIVARELANTKGVLLGKNCNHGGVFPQLFALGGWGGENLIYANPKTFKQKTSQNFPTMGYGFSRKLWNQISLLKNKILDHGSGDWSVAVASCLVRFATTKGRGSCELRGFTKHYQIQVFQPSLSRVWHIGVKSSVGSDHSKSVQSKPTWINQHLLHKGDNLTQIKGRYDWFGFPCGHNGRDQTKCQGQFASMFPFRWRHSVNFTPTL